MAGYKYNWTCPNCGTYLQLKMRVTQTRRKCPQCGFVVTPEEIDRQKWYSAFAGFIIVAAIWLCCASPAGTGAAIYRLLIGILVLGAVAVVVYVGYKVYEGRKQAAKKLDFLRSADFDLIRDFARSELRLQTGAHEKLQNLLHAKGWNFTSDQIDAFASEEAGRQFREERSDSIARHIRSKMPTDRESHLRAYLEASHPNEDDFLHVLDSFLPVGQNEHAKLTEELRDLRKKDEMHEFERKLRGKN